MGEEHQQYGPGLYTLREAAALTGLTTEAIRLRIKRGKLAAEKGNDGRPRVRLTTADLEALRPQKPTVDEHAALLDQQESAGRNAADTTLAVLEIVERLSIRVDAAQAAATEARERAAKAEGEAVLLRDALTRAEARAHAAEREVNHLRTRGLWARLRNWP